VAAVQEPPGVELRERPPDALDVALVIGDVGVVQVEPEAELLGELRPLFRVAKHAVQAAPDEGLDAVGEDRVLARDPQLLLDLDLDRQAVGVPAGPAGDVEPAHRLVAGEDVLHDTGQRVAVVGKAVGRRRPLVEHEARPAAALLQRLVEDVPIAPEVANARLDLRKVHDGRDFLETSGGSHGAHRLPFGAHFAGGFMPDYFGAGMRLYLERLVDWGALLTQAKGEPVDAEAEVGAFRTILETVAALAESFEAPARSDWAAEAELTPDGGAESPPHIRAAYERLRESSACRRSSTAWSSR
jgi:hypothetical protein